MDSHVRPAGTSGDHGPRPPARFARCGGGAGGTSEVAQPLKLPPVPLRRSRPRRSTFRRSGCRRSSFRRLDPVEQPPTRLIRPPAPSQGGSTPTRARQAGPGNTAPSLGAATAPRGGAAPASNAPRAAAEDSAARPRRPQGRREANRSRRGGATARAASNPSVADRFGDAIGDVPWQFTVTIGALAFLGLVMAGRSALSAARVRRLTRQRAELRFDVGALQSALLPHRAQRHRRRCLSVAYRPAEGPAAGGDFHDVVPLDEGAWPHGGRRFGARPGSAGPHRAGALHRAGLPRRGLQPRLALRLTDEALPGRAR